MEKTKKEKKPLMTKNEKEFVCTLFALIIIAIFFIATPPSGLSADGMKVLGVFISVLFLWITVGIGWPSLLCLATLALVPSLGMKTTLKIRLVTRHSHSCYLHSCSHTHFLKQDMLRK